MKADAAKEVSGLRGLFYRHGTVQNQGLAPAVTSKDQHPQILISYSLYLLWEEQGVVWVLVHQTLAFIKIPNREDSIVFWVIMCMELLPDLCMQTDPSS